MHPDIQEKAFQEIMNIFPTDNDEITYESLSKLEYVECVMKESLRIGPTVHAIARENMENFEIIPGKIIKKGSLIAINIYGLHHRKDLWGEEADEFKPERFFPENFDGKQQYFIPFSSGKRNCIGKIDFNLDIEMENFFIRRSRIFSSSFSHKIIQIVT